MTTRPRSRGQAAATPAASPRPAAAAPRQARGQARPRPRLSPATAKPGLSPRRSPRTIAEVATWADFRGCCHELRAARPRLLDGSQGSAELEEMHMAKWLARGMAIVGVVALGWASHGIGSPVSVTPAKVPCRPRSHGPGGQPAARRQTRGRVVETLGRQPLRFEANAGQFARRRPLRGARRRLRRRPDGDRRDAQPGVPTGTGAAVAMTVVGRDGAPAAARGVERPRAAARRRQPLSSAPTRRAGSPASSSSPASATPASTTASTSSSTATSSASSTTSWSRPAPIRRRSACASTAPIGVDDRRGRRPAGPRRRRRAAAPARADQLSGDRRRRAARSRAATCGSAPTRSASRSAPTIAPQPLTIDPVLIYSSFFGGTSEEYAFDIALDPAGNIYVTGQTIAGAGFPTTPGALPADQARR